MQGHLVKNVIKLLYLTKNDITMSFNIFIETFGIKLDPDVDIRKAILRRQSNANIFEIDFHMKVDKEHSFLSILGVLINMLGGKLTLIVYVKQSNNQY